MRIKLHFFFLFVLVGTITITLGKNNNKTKLVKSTHKKHINTKGKSNYVRTKRSLDENEEDKVFWPQRGRRLSSYKTYHDVVPKMDPPFWGARGRRDSLENYFGEEVPSKSTNNKFHTTNCKTSFKTRNKNDHSDFGYLKERRDEFNSPFWGNRGRRNFDHNTEGYNPFWGNRGRRTFDKSTEDNEPFWGNRGRRTSDESAEENDPFWGNRERRNSDENAEGYNPFWGNRGRRTFDKSTVDNDPFWGNRGRRNSEERAEENEPFWGNRGRRNFDKNTEGNDPFWGNRGRRNSDERTKENDPFWGNRGRRNSDESVEENGPFWGNRGRRNSDESVEENGPFWGNRGRRNSDESTEENGPFWGNRGRRNSDERSGEIDPFWGARGRRQDEQQPFWGHRGRRYDVDTHETQDPHFWENRGRRDYETRQRDVLKNVLNDAVNKVEDNIESLTRIRRENNFVPHSFWSSRGRDSQLNYLFKGRRHRYRIPVFLNSNTSINSKPKPSESSTLYDDRMYAEQPHYIVIERSSRSSSEDDPFFISRGKKRFIRNRYLKAARDRRGAIEELVKSVRNDPYYIARGKKDVPDISNVNTTSLRKKLGKAKDLICATMDLIFIQNEGYKTKREVDDNERERRTILKKLAAQLQMDPYFVSRGKKNESDVNENNLEDFFYEISSKCNVE